MRDECAHACAVNGSCQYLNADGKANAPIAARCFYSEDAALDFIQECQRKGSAL